MLLLPRHRKLRRQLVSGTPFRARSLLAAVACCVLLVYFLAGRFGGSSRGVGGGGGGGGGPTAESEVDGGEEAALERLMNSGPLTHPWKLVESSVDWGSIRYRYPPQEPLRQLPEPPAAPGEGEGEGEGEGGGAGRRARAVVQHRFGPESAAARRRREERREAVRRLTRKCWDSYRRFAWKRDALLPLSGAGRDQFSGWAATLVDSLDTLWIMGLRDEFDEAVAAVAEIDFGTSTSGLVNMFETNIRYLGGLLAAYDLSGRDVLLRKAVELGDLIYGGFNTPNRMPVDNINFEAAKRGSGLTVEGRVVSASPGTLSLELTRLSQLTGDAKYYDAVAAVTELFYAGQNHTALPGLFPMWVSMAREDVTRAGDTFTLGGCADSLYEYFPKMHALLAGAEPQYETLTRGFLDAAKRHLFFRPMVPVQDPGDPRADMLISGNVRVDEAGNPHLDPETEHLACFVGGTFALAGRLLGSDEDVEVGARLARGCVYAYRAFPTGMMPERLNMVPCPGGRGAVDDDDDDDDDGPCPWDEARWRAEAEKRPEYKPHLPKGFTTAKDPRYILRPEAIESVFYLWRITGDDEWQEAAWDMFQAVAKGTATELANAAVLDVTVALPKLPQEDYMESFWIAETLKYFYLVFSPPDLISLDKYVLNTEAHPFRLP